MKIQVISDLHHEFLSSPVEIVKGEADVLVLAGDICVASHLERNPTAGINKDVIQNGFNASDAIVYRQFFEQVSDLYDDVLFVMGNHEHYRGRWDKTEDILRKEFARYGNIHLMENDKKVIDDVVFLGASLWTDLNKRDPITEFTVRDMMSDFNVITMKNGDSYHKLTPVATVNKHEQSVQWLKTQLELDKRPTVVITHHAPSPMSIHTRYRDQFHMNGAFVSNLEWMMQDHLKLWIHGHVHDHFDYMVDKTRVLCNPKGYPQESTRSLFNPNLIVEIV